MKNYSQSLRPAAAPRGVNSSTAGADFELIKSFSNCPTFPVPCTWNRSGASRKERDKRERSAQASTRLRQRKEREGRELNQLKEEIEQFTTAFEQFSTVLEKKEAGSAEVKQLQARVVGCSGTYIFSFLKWIKLPMDLHIHINQIVNKSLNR